MQSKLQVTGFILALFHTLVCTIVISSPLKLAGSQNQNSSVVTTNKPRAGANTTKPVLSQPLNISKPSKSDDSFACNPLDDASKPRNRSIPMGCRVPIPRKIVAEEQARSKKGRKSADVNHLFREEVENYPEEDIRLALDKTPTEFKELYNVLNTPLDPNSNLTERVARPHNDDDYNINDREIVREESVCRTVTRNIYPREGNRGEDNSLVYIPNNQEFMQVIQAELCQHPEDECGYLRDNLPYGMVSVCQQRYAYKKLMYLDPLEKRMASDLFRYPSCCSCYVRHSSVDLRSSTSTLLSKNSSDSYTPSSLSGSNQLRPKLDKSVGGSGDGSSSSQPVGQPLASSSGQRPQQNSRQPHNSGAGNGKPATSTPSLLNTNPQLQAREWATLGANAGRDDATDFDKTTTVTQPETSGSGFVATDITTSTTSSTEVPPISSQDHQQPHHQQQRRRAKALTSTATIVSDTEFTKEEENHGENGDGGELINAKGKRINESPTSTYLAVGNDNSSLASPIRLHDQATSNSTPTTSTTGSQQTSNSNNKRLRKNQQQQPAHHTIVLHEDKKYTPMN